MKIKFLKPWAGYAVGATETVADTTAKDLISKGIAESAVDRLWVKALADLPQFNQKAGAIFALDDKNVVEELVSAELAEKASDPTQGVLTKAMSSLTDAINSVVPAAVEKALAEATSKAATLVKGRIPAQPKSDDGLFGFKHAGEFYAAVKAAANGDCDRRLIEKAAVGNNTLNGEDGGFLVPPQISNTILELAFPDSSLLQMTDLEAISAPSMIFNAVKDASRATGSRRGGIQAYWIEQAESFTTSKPQWRQMLLRPYKLGVLCYATEEQLTDTNIVNVSGKFAQYAAEEIRFMVHDAILNGTGTGMPTGIIEHAGTVTVTPEAGQNDTIVFQNIVKMLARHRPLSGRRMWLANIDTLPQLASLAFPTSNIPLFLNVSNSGGPSIGQAMQGTLFGYPIVFTEHNPTLGTKGDIMLVDLAAYKAVTRGGINSAMSIHVQFATEQTAFRFSFRVDGQPWLDTTITPFKGSATLSPFVQLADR